ncbi:MAG TPA: M48 family metallopeptidase [Steroidobacteraceae bacterium]|jgi:Zn-dependent protease with chaperone function
MDFYARQAAARSHSRWLVLAFLASLLAVGVALDIVIFTALSVRGMRDDGGLLGPVAYATTHPAEAILTTLGVVAVLGLASAYKSLELRGGGGVVARSLGGVRVDRDGSDLKRKRLLNIVEEMSIASGVPMPEVYVLEQETAINAFAAGHTPANAAITVTQGALDALNREQLQGVIGHEFSHVLNGDMRLNIQLMGWVFGLFIVALIGRMILNSSSFVSRDRRNSNVQLMFGLAVLVLGYVGLFFGRLLQAAVSRQRERLADASGVQFTRNPQGLKEALVKIAIAPDGSALRAPNAEQAAHMFFAEGLSRAFATHPPILERIRELDPQFSQRDLEHLAEQMQRQGPEEVTVADARPGTQRPADLATQMTHLGSAGLPGAAVLAGATVPAPAMTPIPTPTGAAVATQVGRPDTLHIEQAKALRLAIPPELHTFAESSGHAQAVVLALLLSRDAAVRGRQIELLNGSLGANNTAVVQQAAVLTDALAPLLRLPLFQQVFPALRRVPVAQRKALARIANDLILTDARIDVFEFCLSKLLETLLNDEMEARAPHGALSLDSAQGEIAVLFATLAQIGAEDERAARMAYEAGMSSVLPMRRPDYRPPQDWAKELGEALPRLDDLHPFAKKAVVEGLVKTVANDDLMTVEEAELLRAVCALLHCPLPPLMAEGLNPA